MAAGLELVSRVIAVDWSGAATGSEQKIWLAEVVVPGQEVVRLEAGRNRASIAAHLVSEARRSQRTVVGLDFAFSLPQWFLRSCRLADAVALWQLVATDGERWLAECASPFWGRPGTTRPQLEEHFRRTDREVPAIGGIRPKSVFQIGGAGAVGTGSIRGMPLLNRLREAGFSIWPFDSPSLPMVVEIYPRALTGAVVKGDPDERQEYLQRNHPQLDPRTRELAAASDDAFDALVSALAMAHHAEEFRHLPAARDDADRFEGRIWLPNAAKPARPVARRERDSSKTRVHPVFEELSKRHSQDAQWISRLLDLAAPAERQDRSWRQQDLTPIGGLTIGKESGLQPPVALLSWLIRNFDPPSGSVDGTGETADRRLKLMQRNPQTISDALAELRRGGQGKAWYVLEGPTYPDLFVETQDALIVIEGKRTEPGATVRTTWMKGRHQMLRHLDAAFEVRARRSVYGVLIVEGDREQDPTVVPDNWRDEAARMIGDALETSLPHRGLAEQRLIAESFVGVTTWQAICREFGLPESVLKETVSSGNPPPEQP